ncbi:Serine carboxypeptidase S28 [Aphelenchoides besseyi]|nr:Serine carboxypeptidase S28 [Aphelenchoides besseyi]
MFNRCIQLTGELSSLLIIVMLIGFIASDSHALRSFHHYNFMNLCRELEGDEGPTFGDLNNQKKCPGETQETIVIGYINQTLDNFGTNNHTWGQVRDRLRKRLYVLLQYYQVNNRYWNKSETDGTKIILVIGGEGPIYNNFICEETLTHMVAAKKHGARVLQGTLSAYMRLMFPNATQGNIASSAVLYPLIDFWRYAEVMEKVFDTIPGCSANIAQAFRTLNSLALTDEGRRNLTVDLHLDPPLSSANTELENDLNTVKLSVFDAFQWVVQYNYLNTNATRRGDGRLTIDNVCKMMDTEEGDLKKLYNVYKILHPSKAANTPMNSSYHTYLKKMLDIEIKGHGAADRWLQSTNNNGIFGSAVTLGFLKKICSDLFDDRTNSQTITENVLNMRLKFGFPWDFNARYEHRVHIVLLRPVACSWSELYEKAAHTADMLGPYANEPEGLNESRALVHEKIDFFFGLESTWKKKTPSGSMPIATTDSLMMFLSVIFFHLK